MDSETSYDRYLEFQRYVAWSDYDVQRLKAVGPLIDPALDEMEGRQLLDRGRRGAVDHRHDRLGSGRRTLGSRSV